MLSPNKADCTSFKKLEVRLPYVNPSATSRVLLTISLIIIIYLFILARSSRLGIFKKNPELHVQGVVLHHRAATLRLQRGTTKDTTRIRYEGTKRTSRLYVVCCFDLGDIACRACRSITGSAACFSCLL